MTTRDSAALGVPSGVGVGLRRKHFDDVLGSTRQPAWVEVLPENHFRFGGKPRHVLSEVRRRMPVISHGVSLSIGGPDPIDQRYLDELARFFERVEPAWFTDHLAFSSAFGVQYQDLVPLPFNEQAVEWVAERIRHVQSFIGLPFGIENASYYLRLPGSTMSEGEFFRRVVEETGCGLLLDINNAYVNAKNHGYDAWEMITELPLDRVLQIHLAGHEVLDDGMLFDTHGAPVPDPVWDLYGRLTSLRGPIPTLIEWDNQIPSWDRLMDEADHATAVQAAALLGRAPQRERAPARRVIELATSAPPRPLSSVIELVGRALDGRMPTAVAASELELDALGAERLAFYRELIAGHATSIIDRLYSDTRAALGAERFGALRDAFVAERPMTDYEWNATARPFVELLTERGAPIWAQELVRLEWDWFSTYTDPAEEIAEGAPLTLNPTLSWREHTHKVADWMLEGEATRPPTPPVGEEARFLYRDPLSLKTRCLEPTPRLLLALKIVTEGLSAASLGPEGGALRASVLREAHDLGLLVGDLAAAS